jgi:hypothetical protein
MLRGLGLTAGAWTVAAAVLRVAIVPAQVCPPITSASAATAARESADWMARVQAPDGSYLYEYDAKSGAATPTYSAVRHAGVTMSLYQRSAGGDPSGLAVADRGAAWMEANLIRRDGWAALHDAVDGDAPTGGSALMLAGLAQRRFATGDPRYDALMHELGRFLLLMLQPDGGFLDSWDPARGAPVPGQRSLYSTGEAFWALTLMERAFPGEGWKRAAQAVADYISLQRDTVEHTKFPPWADQWAAYGLSEMVAWPLNDGNVAYARSLAERFGFLVRVEAGRREGLVSRLVRGRRARAAGMGTWVEGLTSLWRIADADPRMRDLEPKIAERALCSAGMLLARQVAPAEAAAYRDPGVARGAWFTEGRTRMDDQQHALSGLLRSRPILDRRERRP